MNQELKAQIKTCITEYTQLDREIKLLKDELKQRNAVKKEMTKKLVSLMESTNVDCFELGKDSIVHKKKKTKQCLSKKYLKTVLSENVDDEAYAEKLLDVIMENRNVREVDVLVCKEASE